MFDVTVIGCGVVGAGIAYELSHCRLSVAIVEKENDIACGTTKANSAIVHAGYDPEPGTKMARLNVEGSRMMEDLCRRLNVEYRRIGSLVLAFNDDEMETVRELFRRGTEERCGRASRSDKRTDSENGARAEPRTGRSALRPDRRHCGPMGACHCAGPKCRTQRCKAFS